MAADQKCFDPPNTFSWNTIGSMARAAAYLMSTAFLVALEIKAVSLAFGQKLYCRDKEGWRCKAQ
jgi:hypothetical protein